MLAFSPFRRAIVHTSERRLWIHEPHRTTAIELEQEVVAVSTFSDGVCFVTASDAPAHATLWRLRYDARDPERLIEVPHSVTGLSICASGQHALVWGMRTTHVTLGGAPSMTTTDETERGVALADGRWVLLRRSSVEVHGSRSEPDSVLSIRRDGRFVFADSLGEPSSILFVHNQPTHSLVQQLNLRTRAAATGLLVPLSSMVRVARTRRMALLWSEASEQVCLLDLRIGRLLASRSLLESVVDLDVDAAAEEVALERDGKLLVMSVGQLMSGGAIAHRSMAIPDGEREPLRDMATEVLGGATPTTPPSMDSGAAVALKEIAAPEVLAAPEPIASDLAELFLDRSLDLVSALCQRAIAIAWNSGRLAFHHATDLPYETEVAALLKEHAPRAAPRVAEADLALLEAVRVYAFLSRDAVLAVGDRIVHRDAFDARTRDIAWPLRTLAEDFTLSPIACDILLALLAPSARAEFARLYAIIRNDPARPLCDEMLLGQLLAPRAPAVAIAAELERGAPLIRYGLVKRGDGERIFAPLTVDPAVMSRLRGMSPVEPDTIVGPPSSRGFWIDNDAVSPLQRALRDAPSPLRLLVRGRPSSGRRTLAALLSRAARRTCVHIDVGTVAKKDALAHLHGRLTRSAILGHLPCVSGLDEPGLDADASSALVRAVRDHGGPLILRSRPDWTPGTDVRMTVIDLPRLSETGRRQVWQDQLGAVEGVEPSTLDSLAARHAVGPGAIISVTERLDGASATEAIDRIESRLADARESRLGTVATRVTKLTRWEDVVLPEDVWQRIQELMARVKYRRQVYETWGFQNVATTALGITALFQGGPGTGKTLVAGAIARELDYELYRVDVSRIVSKWIGETEKNLATIFDSAEDGRLVLLFDEADTLFAKRTEVKSSVDRYANSEVNFLLQRLDSFQGVAILTTNRPGAMDPAFQRRLSMAVAFPEPDEELRERIWEVHIPKAVPRAPDLDLGEIARHHQFSGGHIRNAVMRALFFAASEGTPLTQAHLSEAIRLEYQNLGKLSQGGAVDS